MAFLDKHKAIETHATLLMVLSLLVVTIGGIVQIRMPIRTGCWSAMARRRCPTSTASRN